MIKKILVICHTFPPYPGIGGRRWVKFSKYLDRMKYDVHVICSENPYITNSEWTKDISASVKIYKLPLNYPKSLILYPTSIIGKLRYRIDKLIVKAFSKGNYYDRAVFWETRLLSQATQIIKDNGISNVIATGAPFHILNHTVKLKDLFPEINIIIDFRDYWINDTSLSSFNHLSDIRKQEEIRSEKNVIERADIILTVADEMTDYFKTKYKKAACYTLINGFDEDDFLELNKAERVPDNNIRFVYTGNLYEDIDYVFIPFCEALVRLKKDNSRLYERLSFDFYGNQPLKYHSIIKEKKLDVVKFHPQIKLEDALLKISNSNYCMLFLNMNYNFSLSTKFCEYIGLNKKILLFSNKGKASDFIMSNNLGLWMKPECIYENLIEVINNVDIVPEDQNNVRNSFSIKAITNQLEQHFI